MNYQDVINTLYETYPVEFDNGVDLNYEARTNILHILKRMKKDNLGLINEALLKDYALDQEKAWTWAFRAMCFLYEIEAIESVSREYASVLFTY